MKLNARENPDAAYYGVYLDGVKLDLCFEADDKEGYALVYETDAIGRPKIESWSGSFIEKRLTGKIEFRKTEELKAFEKMSEFRV